MLRLAVIVAIGAAAGGFVQGLSGFAFGLVSLGIWAATLDPTLAGPLVVFGSILGQLLSFNTVRGEVEGSRILPFVIGGLLGVPLGVALLRQIDPFGFKLAVGIILLVWCPAMLLARNLPHIRAGGRLADAGAGWVGGVMGGLGGLNGPAPILWCTLRGWGRGAQRSVFQTYGLATQGATMATYIATGTVGLDTLWLFAVMAPAMLIPTLVGARLYRRFSDSGFRRLVLALLTLSGIALVCSSLAQLL